jgi:hypothetical protein
MHEATSKRQSAAAKGYLPTYVSGAPHRDVHVIFATCTRTWAFGWYHLLVDDDDERKPDRIHCPPCKGVLGTARFECVQTRV